MEAKTIIHKIIWKSNWHYDMWEENRYNIIYYGLCSTNKIKTPSLYLPCIIQGKRIIINEVPCDKYNGYKK